MKTSPDLEIKASGQFIPWLVEQHLSLVFSTYQTNRLFCIGVNPDRRLALQERLFDKPMGLFARGDFLYMSTRYQIWQFDNLLAPGELRNGCDRLYFPKQSHTTGELNVHDLVLDDSDNLLFVNTDFSCLARLSRNYSFEPIWKPPFISKLVAEDRCHLNGLAMRNGQPAYMTACSATDIAAGWREHRVNGGVAMEIESNEIVARGLSMPHSPRWYRKRLWLLNSGTGELGYVERDRQTFVPLTFCPGFVRGLAFYENVAFVGLSKLRSRPFTGLVLEEKLNAVGQNPQCGLMVIDLDSGKVLHWLYLEGVVEELFDVVVLPEVRQPQALGFQSDEIERLVTFPGAEGIITTKPTVKRPSLGGMAPITGLPREVWSQEVSGEESREIGEISALPASPPSQKLAYPKFQSVYHLTPNNLQDYDEFTFPRLQNRWPTQPQRGELFGISASVAGEMVALAIAEILPARTAELLSLFVAPAYRQRGIGTRLVAYLERGLRQESCTQITVTFEATFLTQKVLEPLLHKLGWQVPITRGNQRQSYKRFVAATPTQAKPRVSLVMTVYNMEAYLAEALDSILAQTFPHWELLLWDDGSTDGSLAIAQQYAQRDLRIHFQAGTRLGRIKALKEAHSLTKGEYVGWVDADDRLAPTALEETVAFLDAHPDYGMVYTNHIDMDAQGNPKGLGYRCQIPYRPHRLLIDLLTFHFRLLRQSVFEKVGGINAEMECAEDYDLCLRVEEVSKIFHLERPLYFYRLNPQGITHQQNITQRQASELAVNQALERRGLAQTYRLICEQDTGKFRLQRRDTASISDSAKARFQEGKQLARQGNLEGAIASFTKAIRLQPDYLAAYNQLGNVYQQLGQTEEAIASYQHLLFLNPNVAQTHCNLGAIWQIQGKTEDALAAYQKAIELKPDFALAYLNLGRLYLHQKLWQEAEPVLREAIRLQPNLAEAHYELGNSLRQRGKFPEAIASGETALKLQPQLSEAWNSLGCLWMQQGEMQKAQACFAKVLKLNPDYPQIYRNLGNVLENQGKFTEALDCYNQILEKNPDATEVFYQKEHLRLILCDWDEYDQRMETLHQRLQAHLKEENAAPLPPLSVNCFRIPIVNHIAVAKHWSKYVSRSIEKIKPQFPPPAPPSPKLRLGYLSADFRQHAMGTLIHQLFQYHDSSQFEVYGYSLHHRQDRFTAIIKDGLGHFWDLSSTPPEEAAGQIHGDGIHILIDLTGYTAFSRPEILGLQPAPIQIQYLGYPNTMGAEFIQYILADRWLIPPELEGYYTESVVRLPYALVGSPLQMSDKPLTRADFGLPSDSFVFCCFNRTDKFEPEVFGTWMRILAQVPHSVLWLMETVPEISQNLRNMAQKQGITGERLVFTPRLPLDEYLKAYTLADLFLDTWVYNAGATAIQALGAGLPLITCPGQTFAARMGASICAAADLDWFICNSVTAYEQKAVHLATHPDELNSIRQRLQEQRHTLPLFQPQRWVADLEATCWQLWGKVHPG